jgi:RNA polymerase sigma-70 factor (ECF subfamily)
MSILLAATKKMSAIAWRLEGRDDERFVSLMEATYRKVYTLAFRLAGNRSDAEDLTQEAFYRAYRSFSDYEGDKPFENWIYRIVTRLFLDLLRSRRRRIRAMSFDVPLFAEGSDEQVYFEMADSRPNPEAELLNDTLSEDLQLVLKTLSTEQRLLVLLADVEQMPYKDIAEILGRPVGTVRSRLHRAHKLLRRRLELLRSNQHSRKTSVRPARCPAGA